MSTLMSEKIRSIRKAEGLTQKEFASRCGLVLGTLKNYETDQRSPNFEAVQKICSAFPQYTLFLMHDEMPVTSTDDQLTPEEKKLRDLSTAEKNG